MTYIQELLARNPLVIDGDTIRPHHKYTDDLCMGSEKTMATVYEYEAYKAYLRTLNLSWQEYQKRIDEWCRKKQILEVDKNKKLWYNMFVEYEATKLYNIA